jgi:hypothetical protein
MAERKAILIEWFTLYGSLVGLQLPDEWSDENVRRFWHQLCLQFHPDKHQGQSHGKRVEHFFAKLSGIYDDYAKNDEELPRPGPDFFEAEEVPVDHGNDSMPKASSRMGRRVYLVTFSHSEGGGRRSPSEFSREQFGQLLIKAFEAAVPRLMISYLAVFQEKHAYGASSSSQKPHFHASVKSSRQHLWAPIAKYLREKENVFVHFATSGEGYHSAFRYGWWPSKHKPLSELDKDFLLLNGTEEHPSPVDAAKRPPFWRGGRSSSADGASSTEDGDQEGDLESKSHKMPKKEPQWAPATKREPLWAHAFHLIRDHGITSGDAFLSLVKRLQDSRLISLCMQKSADGIVEKALHVAGAESRIKRSEQSRVDLLRAAGEAKCSCPKEGDWKSMAIDLLRHQQISAAQFASAVICALESGAGKAINVFIFGPTSSAKSWVIDPLRLIFSCHLTPPKRSTFPLQELPTKEVILWQDFRLDEDVLPWGSLLLLFEGTEVTIRRPRTEFPTDQNYKVSQAVFITSVGKLHHNVDEEQKMMDGRFRFFHFAKTLPAQLRRKVEPCAVCFATLIISLAEPPTPALQLSSRSCPNSPSSSSASQNSSSSQSSAGLPYCGDCGLLRSSSNFCTATGQKHC